MMKVTDSHSLDLLASRFDRKPKKNEMRQTDSYVVMMTSGSYLVLAHLLRPGYVNERRVTS